MANVAPAGDRPIAQQSALVAHLVEDRGKPDLWVGTQRRAQLRRRQRLSAEQSLNPVRPLLVRLRVQSLGRQVARRRVQHQMPSRRPRDRQQIERQGEQRAAHAADPDQAAPLVQLAVQHRACETGDALPQLQVGIGRACGMQADKVPGDLYHVRGPGILTQMLPCQPV